MGDVIWSGKPTQKAIGVDPSYGGGDACVLKVVEWGDDIASNTIIKIIRWKQIKLNLGLSKSVEDQLADAMFDECEELGIPYENCFYDPYGKGTLGFALSRRFPQGRCPIPVDSGGRPTSRPVRAGLFVDEVDKYGNINKRLKRCDEHYSKFVTESWFSVRYCIEANQLRGLPESTMMEGCARKYDTINGNRIEVEPKDEMKARGVKSPNQFDALAIAIEGARQRGFVIGKLGSSEDASITKDAFDDDAKNWKETIKSKLLKYA